MAGDYTRFRYSPLKDTTGVQMQQGRVLLDQDWNEYVQLQDRRWRSETMDIMGRAVVPADTPNGFEILIGGTSFTIGVGRMYVDGLQPENHGVDPADPTKRKYDWTLGEFVGLAPIPYEKQPYLPNPPALPTDTNPHLVYLDVWERELTYLEDFGLIDQAVAVDTGARLQTVWQVKVLADSTGIDCSTPPINVAALAPSAGRLTTAAAGVPASSDPCIVPANGGYRGSGNRCYRVEIHNGGPMGTAQFKWSRDNASVATSVTGINAGLDTLTVVLTKRDSVLRFQPNDWVEVTDDFRYFAGLPGEMRQVAVVDDVNLTIKLKTTLPVGEFDATNPDRHTRVIRWDQSGIVRDPIGTVIVDVDTNGGLIPVPAAGTTIVLEDGIQITFGIDATMPVPSFLALDYWMFDARVIDASIEILTQAAPRGIVHHYAWLAFVTFPAGPANNCRIPWPPSSGGSCDCTVCVSAASHNSGALTIQSAVNQVSAAGGKICLGPGTYLITAPVAITASSNIEISGHGLPSLVATGFTDSLPIFQIDGCSDINIHDVSFVGPAAGPNQPPVLGIAASNSLFTRIYRCLFTGFSSATGAAPGPTSMSLGVGLSGFIWGALVQDSFFNNTQVGIGAVTSGNATAAFIGESSIERNQMICTTAGFEFDDPKLVPQFLDVSFTANGVTSPVGFAFGGQGLDIVVDSNTFNVTAAITVVAVTASMAIACSGSQLRISNNQIFGALGTPGLDGIVLTGHVMYGTQITGNQIDGLAGTGIFVRRRTILMQTNIFGNQLLALGDAGFQMQRGSFAIDLNITANAMTFVGLAPGPGSFPAGILCNSLVLNVNINENIIEAVGPEPNLSSPRAGIWVLEGVDVRIGGNRVIDIGPQGAVNVSAGVFPFAILGRLDIVDNEIRRASLPSLNGDASQWSALLIGLVLGFINVRGNMLESFGSEATVLLALAGSCIFTENQVFLDNPVAPTSTTLAVQLGARIRDTSLVGAIVASNNLVQTPIVPAVAKTSQIVMILNPASIDKTVTVLGNITTGDIQVNGSLLAAPWLPLNAQNI
jgi:hypothetical protein